MKKTITTYHCDICKKETQVFNDTIQVIFTTEQTEGRGVKPYLSEQKLDICKDCMDYVCKGNYIWAHGAMGFNEYYFKSVK